MLSRHRHVLTGSPPAGVQEGRDPPAQEREDSGLQRDARPQPLWSYGEPLRTLWSDLCMSDAFSTLCPHIHLPPSHQQ